MEEYLPKKIDPIFKSINMSKSNIDIVDVLIEKEEYEICENFSFNTWSNEKSGVWGSGLINKDRGGDSRIVERTGILGEMAFAKIFGVKVNLKYVVGGEKVDFEILNKKIDIKTASYNYNSALIKAANRDGIRIPLNSDGYVFSYVDQDNRSLKIARLIFVGWQKRENIEALQLSQARRGNHYNYDMPYCNLKSIKSFYEQYMKKIKGEQQ